MTTNDDPSPPGRQRDPAGQTRWWDGTRWTEHVQPAATAAAYGAVFGSDPRSRARSIETFAGFVVVLVLGGLVSWLVIIAAFVLGVVATVISVRRPTPKFRPVFALVASSVLLIVAISRVVSVMDLL